LDKNQKSVLEENIDTLVSLLNNAPPGIIQIGGGEIGLYDEFYKVIEALPQHRWIIITNLSRVPDWYYHKNIILIGATPHDEFAKPDMFLKNCRSLGDKNKRVSSNLLVKPNEEYKSVALYKLFWDNGVPAHLAPLLYHYYYSSSFVIDMIKNYRTSCMANAKFFLDEKIKTERKCAAGMKNHFFINHNGFIGRCNSNFEQIDGVSTIFNPVFYEEAKLCGEKSKFCYCEHNSGLSLADENKRVQKFIETGLWEIPSIDELYDFVKKMRWDPSGRTHDNDKGVNLFDDDAYEKIYGLRKKFKETSKTVLKIIHDRRFWTKHQVGDNQFTYFGAKEYYASAFFAIPKPHTKIQKLRLVLEYDDPGKTYWCMIQDENYNNLYDFKGNTNQKEYTVFIDRNIKTARLLLYYPQNVFFSFPKKTLIISKYTNITSRWRKLGQKLGIVKVQPFEGK
jgi:hypothetical protein